MNRWKLKKKPSPLMEIVVAGMQMSEQPIKKLKLTSGQARGNYAVRPVNSISRSNEAAFENNLSPRFKPQDPNFLKRSSRNASPTSDLKVSLWTNRPVDIQIADQIILQLAVLILQSIAGSIAQQRLQDRSDFNLVMLPRKQHAVSYKAIDDLEMRRMLSKAHYYLFLI